MVFWTGIQTPTMNFDHLKRFERVVSEKSQNNVTYTLTSGGRCSSSFSMVEYCREVRKFFTSGVSFSCTRSLKKNVQKKLFCLFLPIKLITKQLVDTEDKMDEPTMPFNPGNKMNEPLLSVHREDKMNQPPTLLIQKSHKSHLYPADSQDRWMSHFCLLTQRTRWMNKLDLLIQRTRWMSHWYLLTQRKRWMSSNTC